MNQSATSTRVTGIGEGYDVAVAAGMIDRVGEYLPPCGRAAVVTNDVVAPLYLERIETSLRAAGVEPISVVVPDGERHKTLATVQFVYDALLPRNIERGTPLIALGGGVTTDLAGFAAATLLRGLPLVSVPTSLLAMVDASVGGKTGVNHAAGKNLIGSFHPPHAVLIDPATLATLPPRELRGGLAECVKHDVIRDAAHLDAMESNAAKYLAGNADALAELVVHNVRIKVAVVAADPFERGERAHLNLGHTFGHAFETVTRYAVSHGEAVAVGTVCACRVAVALGMLPESDAAKVERVLVACGLPTGGVSADVEQVIAAMSSDKKVRAGRVRFVLPDRLGHAVVRDDVPPQVVRDAVMSVCAR